LTMPITDKTPLVDDVVRAAGVDLWGAAANEPPLPLSPALPTAISLAMRIEPRALVKLRQDDPAPYRLEYVRLNEALDAAGERLAAALRAAGHEALALPATVYTDQPPSGDWLAAGVFPHKSAATRAGLGWIGKTALFVSPELGPRLRLATVFSDVDLSYGTPVVEGRCGSCRSCIVVCPARAGRDVTWVAGTAREELFDAAACERHLDSMDQTGHRTCGLCVAACPFGRSRSG
jgi:epoxyqueuosine reductase